MTPEDLKECAAELKRLTNREKWIAKITGQPRELTPLRGVFGQ